MRKTEVRTSGIEILKIFAMLMIILNHVTQSLCEKSEYFINDYVFPLNYATTNVQNLILVWFRSLGAQGNVIFFVCSAWFLFDSKSIDMKKIIYLLSDSWMISMLFLNTFELGGVNVDIKELIKCFFPTITGLNWYIPCYCLFYLIHLSINQIIKSKTQKQLLSISMVSLILYCGINYIYSKAFFASQLIEFAVIYIAVVYMKKYMHNYCNNKKLNLLMLIVGTVGIPLLILSTNYLGLHLSFFQDKLLHWGRNCSPFCLLTAVSLLNLFNNKRSVKIINYISSMSLLVYLIHENLLVRTYIRPYFWLYIYKYFGYDHVIFWCVLQAVAIFVVTMIISAIYKNTIQKITYKIADRFYDRIVLIFEKVVGALLIIN